METLLKMKKSENKRRIEINSDYREQHKKNAYEHPNHVWIILIAHIIPIGLLILLPILGFTGAWTFILPIVIMIGIHIWMMKDHLKY